MPTMMSFACGSILLQSSWLLRVWVALNEVISEREDVSYEETIKVSLYCCGLRLDPMIKV